MHAYIYTVDITSYKRLLTYPLVGTSTGLG
jgi:hypothetical protein